MRIYEFLHNMIYMHVSQENSILANILGWAGGLLFVFINVADWIFGITAVFKILGLITSSIFSYYGYLVNKEVLKAKKKENESN